MTGETTDLKKQYQFFPTPRKIAEMMCDMAELDNNSVVLEPSCGKGDLADVIWEHNPKKLVGSAITGKVDASRTRKEPGARKREVRILNKGKKFLDGPIFYTLLTIFMILLQIGILLWSIKR